MCSINVSYDECLSLPLKDSKQLDDKTCILFLSALPRVYTEIVFLNE